MPKTHGTAETKADARRKSADPLVRRVQKEMDAFEIEGADEKLEEALRLLTIAEMKYRAVGREDDANRCVRAMRLLAK